jgi:hypothetical protein
MDGLQVVTVAATALSGVLAGASLDQSFKQLPARRRIGAVAYSAYSRASDLGRGIAWYAGIGIGAALLTVVAAVWAFALGMNIERALPLYGAALLSLLHSLVTSRAAPTLFSQRRHADAAMLGAVFDRFARWQSLRAALQVLAFPAMLWGLVVISGC